MEKLAADGEWHKVEISAQLNTVPARRLNGILHIEYDDEVVYHAESVRFRQGVEDLWEAVFLAARVGSASLRDVAPHDMFLDLAGFTLSEEW